MEELSVKDGAGELIKVLSARFSHFSPFWLPLGLNVRLFVVDGIHGGFSLIGLSNRISKDGFLLGGFLTAEK